MNLIFLKELINRGYKLWENDPQNEIKWEETINKIFLEMSKNLDKTIEFINTCSKEELFYISQVFEELSKYFKSQKLIQCVEQNLYRFNDLELQSQIKMELEYMQKYVES